MAKPSLNISKSELYQHYNLVNVCDGATLMKSLSTIKPNHYYAEYTPKGNNLNPPAWFSVYMEAFEKKFDQKLNDLENRVNDKIETLNQKLNKVIELNNLKYE